MLRALRRRLAAWYLAILAMVLLAYGAGTFVLACEVLARGADESNRHLVAPVAAAFARGEEVAEAVGAMSLGEGEHLELLDGAGAVTAARGPRLAALPLVVDVWTQHGPLGLRVLTVPLERGGERVGYVRAAHSLTVANRALAALGIALAVVVPLALAVAWAGGHWLALKAVQPVEAAFERERQFTRDASHELRTPLAVIQAHADLALELPGLPAPHREKVERVRETAGKMARLVGDLLTLSREDAGVHGRAVTFAFEELVEEELEAFAPLAAARQISLEIPALPDGLRVRGEPGRLAQAVRNVLDNAVRYARAPGSVRVTLVRGDGIVSLRVRNPGAAIPEDERERIFERFHRADAGRAANPDGGGLGLPISRAIARAHGGELALVSAAGEETAFELRLPAA